MTSCMKETFSRDTNCLSPTSQRATLAPPFSSSPRDGKSSRSQPRTAHISSLFRASPPSQAWPQNSERNCELVSENNFTSRVLVTVDAHVTLSRSQARPNLGSAHSPDNASSPERHCWQPLFFPSFSPSVLRASSQVHPRNQGSVLKALIRVAPFARFIPMVRLL